MKKNINVEEFVKGLTEEQKMSIYERMKKLARGTGALAKSAGQAIKEAAVKTGYGISKGKKRIGAFLTALLLAVSPAVLTACSDENVEDSQIAQKTEAIAKAVGSDYEIGEVNTIKILIKCSGFEVVGETKENAELRVLGKVMTGQGAVSDGYATYKANEENIDDMMEIRKTAHSMFKDGAYIGNNASILEYLDLVFEFVRNNTCESIVTFTQEQILEQIGADFDVSKLGEGKNIVDALIQEVGRQGLKTSKMTKEGMDKLEEIVRGDVAHSTRISYKGKLPASNDTYNYSMRIITSYSEYTEFLIPVTINSSNGALSVEELEDILAGRLNGEKTEGVTVTVDFGGLVWNEAKQAKLNKIISELVATYNASLKTESTTTPAPTTPSQSDTVTDEPPVVETPSTDATQEPQGSVDSSIVTSESETTLAPETSDSSSSSATENADLKEPVPDVDFDEIIVG